MEFSYRIEGSRAVIDKVLDPGRSIMIPEELDGYPVTELGAYVLSDSDVEELYLPSGLVKIGAYAFYNCKNLRRIFCFGRAVDLGTGLFAGVQTVEYLDITLFQGERSCLKDLLSELRQTLRVRIREVEPDAAAADKRKAASGNDGTVMGSGAGERTGGEQTAGVQAIRERTGGEQTAGIQAIRERNSGEQTARVQAIRERTSGEQTARVQAIRERNSGEQTAGIQAIGEQTVIREARLIFPEYYEDSVENTPARIVSVETHGCGHRYRYCFQNRVFQYRDYDAIFPHMKVQEPEALAAELAFCRLRYPLGLTETCAGAYRAYLAEHWQSAGRILIGADRIRHNHATNLEPGQLPWLVEQVLEQMPEPTPEQIAKPILEQIPKPMPEQILKPVPEQIPKPIPEQIPKPVSEQVLKPVPEQIPKPMSEQVPEQVLKPVPEQIPKPMSEQVPEQIPKPVPEQIPKPVPEQIPAPKAAGRILTEILPSYIAMAQEAGDTEMVSWLMDYRYRLGRHGMPGQSGAADEGRISGQAGRRPRRFEL